MNAEWIAWVKVASFQQLLTSLGTREHLIIGEKDVNLRETLENERKAIIAEIKTRPQYPDEFLRVQDGE